MAKQKSSGWLNKYVQNVPKTFGKNVAASDVTRTNPVMDERVVQKDIHDKIQREAARRQTSISNYNTPGKIAPDVRAQVGEAVEEQRLYDERIKNIAEGSQILGAGLELAAPFTGPFMPIVGGVGAGLGIGSGVYLAGKDALAGNYGSAALNAGFAGLDAAGFAALRNNKVKDFVQGADHVSDYSQVVDLSNIGNTSESTTERMLNKFFKQYQLPETTNKNSLEVLENFKQRIQTPEGQRRLKELGITNDEWLQKLKVVEDPSTYGYYSPSFNQIAIHPNLPEVRHTTRHEIEHGVQDAIKSEKFQKYNKDVGNLKYLFRPGAKKRALEEIQKKMSPIDDLMSNLELRKTPEVVDWEARRAARDQSGVNPDNYFNALSNRQNATNYFDSGSQGQEKSAFLAEVQQYMLDNGYLKNAYDTVTPEMVEKTALNAFFDNKNNGHYLRLFQIMKPNDNNYKLISEGLNKMLSAPTVIGGGAAAATLANQPEQKKNGGWLDKFDEGGEVEDPKKKPLINLGDLTMTPAELEYVNADNSGYCPGGNCLENTRKGHDMLAGRIPGIPTSGDIWTKDLGLISTASRPTEQQVQQYPYFAGDSSFGSADSWDIHGAIVKAGGKNIYSQAKGQTVPKDIPMSSFIGWGPIGTRASNHPDRQKGLNTKYGYQPSHHTTEVVNWDEKGEPIVYDSYLNKYGTLSNIAKDLKNALGYEIENISVPKSVAGNTRANLAKKGILKTELTPYVADVNKLVSGTKQSWAQIKEDGKLRAPNVDMDKLNTFAKALSDNKGQLISSLRISNAEYDRLANTALALAMTESEGGGALGFSDNFGSTQGMTQLNPNNIKKDARLKSALNKQYKTKLSVTNLLDPSASAVATMMYLSVADKDAKRLYEKGLKPGVKTFNEPGFIENFRSTNSRLNGDGIFIDELNKRIPYSQIPGYEDEDVNKVNNYLKKLTKSDKYSFVNKDGDLSLNMKTKGNNPKLTDIEKIAYMWQSPNSLKTGDAEGKSEYVNKVRNYYNLINAKMKDGGELNYNDASTSFPSNFVGQGYDTTGRDYSPAWGGQFAMGGSLPGATGHFYARYDEGGPIKKFLQPTQTFMNFGYNPKENGLSTEYSTTVGKDGEYYLVPGYKQGRLVEYPEDLFNQTGEHLGGPFKTIQSAEDFAKFRHQYVEKNKNIPAPFKTRDYAMGGLIPGDVNYNAPRTGEIPNNGPHAKKTLPSAQDGIEIGPDGIPVNTARKKGDYSPTSIYNDRDRFNRQLEDQLHNRLNIDEGIESAEYYISTNNPGNDWGMHNGPLDAIRHAASSAQSSSELSNLVPMMKYNPGVMLGSILGTNVMGLAHELSSPNPLEEMGSDLYNNLVGSVIGVLPGDVNKRNERISKALDSDLLSNLKGKNSGIKPFDPRVKSITDNSKNKSKKFIKGMGPLSNDVLDSAHAMGLGFQNGGEMKYYQEGLDWKPKSISKNGSQLTKLDQLTNFTNYNTKQSGGWLDKYND